MIQGKGKRTQCDTECCESSASSFIANRRDDCNIRIWWFHNSWVTGATSQYLPTINFVFRREMKSPTQEGATIFQLADMSRSHQVMHMRHQASLGQ
jgi:hypothetical protein